MNKYIKEINGVKVCKTLREIVVTVDDMSTYNPTEEMVLNDGWEKFVQPINSVDELEKAKERKLLDIKRYDTSSNVNEFFLNDISLWLDKESRLSLKFRFESEMACGKDETILWYKGLQFSLKLNDAMDMLYKIEKYASECYDNTQRHISMINSLQTLEEVNGYDYTLGYPDKLYLNN